MVWGEIKKAVGKPLISALKIGVWQLRSIQFFRQQFQLVGKEQSLHFLGL